MCIQSRLRQLSMSWAGLKGNLLTLSDAVPHLSGATLEHYAPKHNLFNTKWHRFCHQGFQQVSKPGALSFCIKGHQVSRGMLVRAAEGSKWRLHTGRQCSCTRFAFTTSSDLGLLSSASPPGIGCYLDIQVLTCSLAPYCFKKALGRTWKESKSVFQSAWFLL